MDPINSNEKLKTLELQKHQKIHEKDLYWDKKDKKIYTTFVACEWIHHICINFLSQHK